MALIDMTGKRFHDLVVLRRDGTSPGTRSARWVCLCDCGNLTGVDGAALRSGRTKSCGCRRGEMHGESGSRTHNVWRNIIGRCTNKNHADWNNYGGRGITVCDAFRKYTEFKLYLLQTFGRVPKKGESIGRIDNSKGYEPGNLRYATPKEQCRNQRSNRIVSVNGCKMTLAEAVERFSSVSYQALSYRLDRGWDIHVALNAPPWSQPKHPVAAETRKKLSDAAKRDWEK